MTVAEILVSESKCLDIEVDPSLAEKLEIYASALKEWNEKINLTAITDDRGIAVKHFLDSLTLFSVSDIPFGASLIDVGTGAGFPGLVIAAKRPDMKITLLDGTGKKLKAVEDIANRLGLTNCTFLHARAEEAGRDKKYREQFDFATARAVAQLKTLLEYTLPFVKPGGTLFAMKSALLDEELSGAENALSLLSGEITARKDFILSDAGQRSVLCVRKKSQLSPRYPRVSAQISKNPL